MIEEEQEIYMIVSMSSSGECPRSLAAQQLDYEATPESPASQIILREGMRHERWIAEDLVGEGILLEEGGFCPKCKRVGLHVELDTQYFKLVGHLDRRIVVNSDLYPLEVKALGRFTFDKFKRAGFQEFSGYEAQELCYLEAEGRPGYYIVKSRDTGELLRFKVPYRGYYPPNLYGFNREVVPKRTFRDIIDKLNLAAVALQQGQLPDYECSDEEKRYCKFKYLCGEQLQLEPDVIELGLPSLLEAADMHIEGKMLETLASERIEMAKIVFLEHAKKQPKFRVGGISVSYRGLKSKEYVKTSLLKQLVSKELLDKVVGQSNLFEDISIRILKEKEEL